MLELMNIYKDGAKEVNCASRVCRGSYVWDLDVEGMTGLWWGEGWNEPEEGGRGGGWKTVATDDLLLTHGDF